MAIWYTRPEVAELNRLHRNTVISHLGIEMLEVGDDFLRGRMPVDARTHQPYGILHGGASVVLAETLGSVAANFCVDLGRQLAVGLEVNANHLRPQRDGWVIGTARPVHLGKTTQVWQIQIDNEAGKAVCCARLTIAVRDLPEDAPRYRGTACAG